MTPQIDYRAVFKSLPGPTALLDPRFVIIDANQSYLETAGRTLDQVVGHNFLDAFPENPADPDDTGPRDLRASLQAVLDSGERDVMNVTRYDTQDPDRPGVFEERYWVVVNAPLCDDVGNVDVIILKAEEVTHLVRQARVVNC